MDQEINKIEQIIDLIESTVGDKEKISLLTIFGLSLYARDGLLAQIVLGLMALAAGIVGSHLHHRREGVFAVWLSPGPGR
ncbi:MAG: hypothetical protein ACLFRE_01690 [Desulfovermiculus sp.]